MNWKRGITLRTTRNRDWSEDEIEKNDIYEGRNIFSDFYLEDQGIIRELVCSLNHYHPDFEKNRILIESAPDLLRELRNIIQCWDNDCFQDSDIETARQLVNQIINP